MCIIASGEGNFIGSVLHFDGKVISKKLQRIDL